MLGVNVQAWAQVYAIRRTCVHLEALEGQTYACLYWVLTLHGGAIGVINTRHQSCSHHTSQTLSASYIKKKNTYTHIFYFIFFILQRFVFFLACTVNVFSPLSVWLESLATLFLCVCDAYMKMYYVFLNVASNSVSSPHSCLQKYRKHKALLAPSV